MKPRKGSPTRPPATPAGDAPEANTPVSDTHEHIPPQWAWHFRTLLRLRQRLTDCHPEPAAPHGVPPAEAEAERLHHDQLWAELGREDDRLFELDCALQRIRDGVYGFCEETGRTIPPERLRAVPWTRFARTAAAPRQRTPHRS